MARRKAAYRKRHQNRFSMFLVTLVVLMIMVVVAARSVELQQKIAGYDTQIASLGAQIEAEQTRAEQIEEFGKYTQTKAYVEEVAKDYPEVALSHMYVDNCAMQLVHNPGQFDVILTENMFGDILSDEAAMISGSLGMLASASLNDTKFGMYEPSHGSAPDIAGQDKANPIATILSASMLLRFSFDMDKEADAIDNAVKKVLEAGYRTGDIMSEDMKLVGCKEMGSLVADMI